MIEFKILATTLGFTNFENNQKHFEILKILNFSKLFQNIFENFENFQNIFENFENFGMDQKILKILKFLEDEDLREGKMGRKGRRQRGTRKGTEKEKAREPKILNPRP